VIPSFERLKARARDFYQKHPDLARSAIVSLVLSAIGFGLLCLGVSILGWSKTWTNVGLAVPMTVIGFYAQRRFGFRSPETETKVGLPKSGAKLVVTYGLVRWGLNLSIGPFSYIINKRLIFRRRTRTGEA
jgi:putative flippase GtrA